MSEDRQKLTFRNRIGTESQRVLVYEDLQLQAKAKRCVPLSILTTKAHENCSSDPNIDLKDALLIELLEWFKQDFFSWFDAPSCSSCECDMTPSGMTPPSPEDIKFGAHRVELYRCQSCNSVERFPRYNDPGKLLETRRGRCGEWANCFTLICRALNYDARYILDWTDHVWTEVYSERKKRWLHCDSCEAICDKPLIYDAGWGKKLNYVIAFSKDEVQDVTWRYTRNHSQVLKRRTLVPEQWLLLEMHQLSQIRQSSLSTTQKEKLTLRLVSELAEFLLPRQLQPEEAQGRTSGDLNWRTSRGEMGNSHFIPIVWTPSEHEINNGEFSLEYSTSLDQYIRRSDGNKTYQKWSSGVFQAESVFRKVEQDWKMSYLARLEGSRGGRLSWKFDLSSVGLTILQVVVSCPGTVYEDGEICWKICGSKDDSPQTLPNGCVDYEVDLTGAKWCVLSVDLSGGRGDVAWQHAQIGRQSTTQRSHFPFAFRILFGALD